MNDGAGTRLTELLEEIARIRVANTSYLQLSRHTEEEKMAYAKRDQRLVEILGELTSIQRSS